MSADIEINLVIECSVCQASLSSEVNGPYKGDYEIKVEPCDTCIQKAIEENQPTPGGG